MDKKIKILLVSLGVASLLAVSMSAWIYISSQAEVAEYVEKQTALEKQSDYLQKRLDQRQKETRHWQEKFEAMKADLNKVGKEYTLLQGQYDSLLSEKDSLAEQNTTLSGQLERLKKLYSREQERARLGASEEFLASLLEEKAKKEVEIGKLKGSISSQQARLESIERQARPSREKLEHLEKELQVLENKLRDAQKVSDVLSSDLLKEKKRRIGLEQELAQTEGHLKGITTERDKLSDQLVKMKQALQQRLLELSRTKKVLESAVEGAEKAVRQERLASIELPPIVVKAEEEAAALPLRLTKKQVVEKQTFEIAGRIITVNTKYKFAVIDIGRDEGVEKGMNFDVYRKGEKVGRIEVIETRQNISACDVKEISVKRLKLNDIVRR